MFIKLIDSDNNYNQVCLYVENNFDFVKHILQQEKEVYNKFF